MIAVHLGLRGALQVRVAQRRERAPPIPLYPDASAEALIYLIVERVRSPR